MFDQADFDKKFAQTVNWLEDKLSKISTGRPRPEMIENMQVEAYGQTMELKSLTTIEVVDGKFRLQPWDKSTLKAIEDAFHHSDLGLNPEPHDSEIFVPLPALTEETRDQRVKQVNQLLEEARISLRKLRHDVMDVIDSVDGVSEDVQEKAREQLQAAVDKANDKLAAIVADKEKELRSI